MNTLISDKLKRINGGGFSFSLVAAIGAGLTFLIGLVDGYFRPLPCR